MYIRQSTLRSILIYELRKLIKKVTEIFINSVDLFMILDKYSLEKVELMIIDSALKGMNLDRLDKTLLIIPSRYETSLINIIHTLVTLLQNKTEYPNRTILKS